MFELAPVSLWLEDYSGLKALFDAWRSAGAVSLRDHLGGDRGLVRTCAGLIRILKVNRRTLSLFEAKDVDDLVANLGLVFRDDMLISYLHELEQLWNGQTVFSSHAVNYSLSGKRLDIQLKGQILPGHEADWSRVLVSIEDVTEREEARRRLALAEGYARGLFDHSPVSLWVEDFSAVKALMDDIRDRGIEDFRVFTDVHPEFVERCMSEIRVIDVNDHTLKLFGAADKPTLLARLRDVFRDAMQGPFREQLVDLWHGKYLQQREVVNYALGGEQLHLHLQFSILPGREHDWSQVQVALTDITARKKAEAYLEFLGKHDALTKLNNRSFYIDELNRLERKGPWPVSIVVADLNGLKEANDQFGHAAGDNLLRRAGEVFAKVVSPPCHAARIGGDEFAILLPGTDEKGVATAVENLCALIDLNNQYYANAPLRFAIGAATSEPGDRLEDVAKRADAVMYTVKRAFYADQDRKRRPMVAAE